LTLAATPTLLRELDEAETHALLIPYAFQSVTDLFGVLLTDDKYITDGTRCKSLGGLRISPRRARFLDDGYGKLRLQFRDSTNTMYRLAVTCDQLQHLFSPSDHDAEPHFGVAEANEWLDANPPRSEIVLRLGLARGWDGPDHLWNPLRCYAQLNGIICPQDNYHIFAGPPGE
jgi:hypothetical protein